MNVQLHPLTIGSAQLLAEEIPNLAEVMVATADDRHHYSVFADGELAGHSYLDNTSSEIGLKLLREHRGRGIGKLVIDGLKNIATVHGHEHLYASVRHSNEPARRLLLSAGFFAMHGADGWDRMTYRLAPPERPVDYSDLDTQKLGERSLREWHTLLTTNRQTGEDEGHLRTPCSRYGYRADECAWFAIAAEVVYINATGEDDIEAGLDGYMRAVVNDNPDVEDLLADYFEELPEALQRVLLSLENPALRMLEEDGR